MLFETFVSSVCLCHAHCRLRFNLLVFCSVLVFRGAALSFRLFCLVTQVAFLLHPSWFPAVQFSAHTSSLVIPALSLVLFCSLIHDFTFFCIPFPGFLWPCIFALCLRTFVWISGQITVVF